ncbi:ATP-binding protein [Flammeovirgaceae bacterium SG7u.111]|nr:ATP-binding protein [Flammeovirgaceae bacterium SG7u.132]WPO37103.1 ATP-binding protein [Flammeovirgaceae bacterium SG7u.111]
MIFREIWNWVGDLGLDYAKNKNDLRKIQLMNRVYFTAALISLIASCLDFATGYFFSGLAVVAIALFIMSGLCLNKAGYYKFSFDVISWIICALIFYLDGSLGGKAGGYFYFLPVVLATAFMSDFESAWIFFQKISAPAFFLSISLFTGHDLFIDNSLLFPQGLSEDHVFVFYVSNFLLSLIAFLLFLYQIIHTNIKNQKMLAFSEAKLRAILNNNDMAMAMVGLSGDVLEYNTEFISIFQNPELVKIDYLLTEDPQKEIWLLCIENAKKGEKGKFFYEKNVNGARNTYRVYCYPVFEDDKVTGVTIFLRDITKNFEIEKEIKRKSQTLNGILENVPVVVFRLNPEGLLAELEGSGLKRLLGDDGDPATFMQRTNMGLESALFVKEFKRYMIDAQNGKSGFFVSKGSTNGECWFYNIHIFPDSVRTGGVIGFAFDVTEQVISKKQIQATNEQLELVLKSSDEGFWDWNVSTNEIYFSPRWKEMFGYKDVDLGKNIDIFEKVLGKEVKDGFFSELLGFVEGSTSRFRQVLKARHREGHIVYIESNAILKNDKEGNLIRIVGSSKDISDLKIKEEVLSQQNEKLLKLNNELDSFVYSTSHDLRAPLASILGLVNISKYETELNVIKDYLLLTEKSIKKLDGFIGDILDYSRNNRLQLAKDDIDFNLLIDEVFDQYVFSGNDEKIQIEIDVHQHHRFVTDRRRLSTVIKNLVSNAIKYADTNKPESLLKIAVVVEKEESRIVVSDNGQGIDQSHLEKIFEMFYKANEYNSGSGLGLYIVNETTRKLGGLVEVESELGKGSTFTLIVPNLKKEESPQVA